jgi:hypothetical protein
MLNLFAEEQHLSGSKKFFCPYCHREQEAVALRRVTRAPQTLMVHIQRFPTDRGEVFGTVKDESFISVPKRLRLGTFSRVEEVIGIGEEEEKMFEMMVEKDRKRGERARAALLGSVAVAPALAVSVEPVTPREGPSGELKGAGRATVAKPPAAR